MQSPPLRPEMSNSETLLQKQAYSIRIAVHKIFLDIREILGVTVAHGFQVKGEPQVNFKISQNKDSSYDKKIEPFRRVNGDWVPVHDCPYGIAPIDSVYVLNDISRKDLLNAAKITLSINFSLSYNKDEKLDKSGDQLDLLVSAYVDLTSTLMGWLRDERELLSATIDIEKDYCYEAVPFREKVMLSVKILARNNPLLQSEGTDQDDETAEAFGKVLIQIYLLNHQRVKLEEEQIKKFCPQINVESTITDMVFGNFSTEVALHLKDMYQNTINQDSELLSDINHWVGFHGDGGKRKDSGIDSKRIPTAAFDALVELWCMLSKNPIKQSVLALILSEKYLKEWEDQREQLTLSAWIEEKALCEKRCTGYLDQLRNISKLEFKMKLLREVSTVLSKTDSPVILAHPAIIQYHKHLWRTGRKLFPFYTPQISFWLNFLAYLVFLVLISFPYFGITARTYWFAQYVEGELQIAQSQTFRSISDSDSFWSWAINVFAQKVFQGDGELFLQMAGQPSIRQLRVLPSQCQWPSTSICLDDLDEGKWQTGGTFLNTSWLSDVGTIVYGGNIMDVPAMGYGVLLPFNYTEFNLILNNLNQSTWIDEATRSVVVEVLIWSPNQHHYALLHLLVEFTASGSVLPSLHTYYIDYDQKTAIDIIGIFQILYIVSFIFREIGDVIRRSLKVYFRDAWNYFDLVGLSVLLLLVCLKFVIVPKWSDPYLVTHDQYFVYWKFFYWRNFFNGLLVAMFYWRLLYFFRVSEMTGILAIAIQNMIIDTLNFLFFALLILFGFVIVFSILLRSEIENYRNWQRTAETLLESTFGEWNFSIIIGSGDLNFRKVIACVLLGCFVVLILIILINLLIAMFSTTFNTVKNVGMGLWGNQFAHLLDEYRFRPAPPPFNFLSLPFYLAILYDPRLDYFNYFDEIEPEEIIPEDYEKKLLHKLVSKYKQSIASNSGNLGQIDEASPVGLEDDFD